MDLDLLLLDGYALDGGRHDHDWDLGVWHRARRGAHDVVLQTELKHILYFKQLS